MQPTLLALADPGALTALAGSVARVLVHVAALWVLATALLGSLAGHMKLLKAYPPAAEPLTRTFPLAAGVMGRMPFRAPLRVGIGSRGLHLAPSWVFRPPTHWGIPCIPWWDLRCTESQPVEGDPGAGWSRFELPRAGLRLAVAGDAGRAIEAAVAAAGEAPRSRNRAR